MAPSSAKRFGSLFIIHYSLFIIHHSLFIILHYKRDTLTLTHLYSQVVPNTWATYRV
jgi:hypothetical protein